MAHCLSHQFAGFMREFNEIIGLAGTINVLIAILIRLSLSFVAFNWLVRD